ncbi:hypothetical protein SAMN05661091_2333 [Paenibacillus uliginis N3/975]|uniref:Fe2OG dioxygenase domain-containing protein n=1 Tax=Paenibacillus uliginis N3/975 TaxID=1313296 RepID=A0A1X7HB80_9BACL|nr:2OG-Fe(II) oxygenase [Paenibacillus uliginis]SMF83202.1 hypothetical protein SAMN05661091_2333 [Paenibacillus uliginis N3/975]
MSLLLKERVTGLDWPLIQHHLDEQGFAKLPVLFGNNECQELMDAYEEETRYRSTINMSRYRFGAGEYKYFQAPLPDLLQQLREALYPELSRTANRWSEYMGKKQDYPDHLEEFLEVCHEQGQTRPTPLILKYEEGGYNCLHQDLYGDISFPFQVVFAINQREKDYTGGQFVLMEQRPRAQSRGHAITLEQGEGLIFPTQHRPVLGSRGYYKTTMRHGVSTITSGTRFSLGIIFHDAK